MTELDRLLGEAQRLPGLTYDALRAHSPRGVRALRLTPNHDTPGPLARFVDLEALVVDALELTPAQVAVIAGLPRLRALQLGGGRGGLVGWSGGFRELEILALPQLEGELTCFGSFLRSLPRLRSLRLPDAQLRAVPPIVSELATLRELEVVGAPIPEADLEALRRARPELAVRTSPINLGWAPGIAGVLRVADGFAVEDLTHRDGWEVGERISIVDRQVTVTVRWREHQVSTPDYEEAIHGPVAVEAFVRAGPPIALAPWDRARLRRHLEKQIASDEPETQRAGPKAGSRAIT